MGKQKRIEKEAARAPSSPEKPPSSPEKPQAAPPATDKGTAAPPRPSLKARLLPEGGLLPWWVGLVISVYVLLQLGSALEHPCGVLGTWSPVTRSQINRAYRSLSVCTHPDKLVGHSASNIQRGDLLFKRASIARDQLVEQLKAASIAAEAAAAAGLPEPPGATCSTHLDDNIGQGLRYIFGSLVEMGLWAVLSSIGQFLLELVTFQYEISTTISIALLLLTVLRTLQQLVAYLAHLGPVTTVLSVLTSVIVGPLPTIGRFIALPPLRLLAFVKHELRPFLNGEDSANESGEDPHNDGDAQDDDGAAATAGGAGDAAGDSSTLRHRPGHGAAGPDDRAPPRRNVKKAVRPQSAAEAEAAQEALLRGQAPPGGGVQGANEPPVLLTELSLTEVLARKPLPSGRAAASAAMQFDLLLSTTKYVIPLVALVATKQVFNGLWSSMITAQLLHRVPAMRPEAHHALLITVGLLHTLLCAGKSQLAEMQSDEVLQLQWAWSLRDVFTVANVMSLGATFSSASGGGNEPMFCASFAAGVALRILVYDFMPATSSSTLAATFRQSAQLELVGTEQVAVRAGAGVGTCAGGPVRAALGWLEQPSLLMPATLVIKATLLMLPVLAAAQWGLHCLQLYQRLKRERQREGKPRQLRTGELLVPVLQRRLALSVLIVSALGALVVLFATFELNAVNSSLGNFLIVALAGCLFESLLSTYDVRGRLRNGIFFVMFMLL